MLKTGPAKKVIIYLNDRTKGKHGPFGSHQRMHSDLYTDAPSDLPMRIEFTDSSDKIERLMPLIHDLVTDGVIETVDVNVVKVAVEAKGKKARS